MPEAARTNRPAVLVTGGAHRIGKAIASAFGATGWHVLIHYRSSEQAAQALADSLPFATAHRCDLTDAADCQRMAGEITASFPTWRTCINSAALFEPDSGSKLDTNVFDMAMSTNARGSALLTQAFLKQTVAGARRCVIQLTDQKIVNPNPDFFSYTMSKQAVAGMVPMLAKYHADDQVRIYGLAPGAILPSHDQTESETKISHRLNLLRRQTMAREIAEGCLFLTTGSLSSGQTLYIDSGQHLLNQARDVIYLARERASA